MKKFTDLTEEEMLEFDVWNLMHIEMLMELIKNAKKTRTNIRFITITPSDEIGLIDQGFNLVGVICICCGKTTFFDEKDFVTLTPMPIN